MANFIETPDTDRCLECGGAICATWCNRNPESWDDEEDRDR